MSIQPKLSFAVLAFLLVAPIVDAQSSENTPSLVGESLSGKGSFQAYCAMCHGVTGRGDGPVAAALRHAPADLTTLTQRYGDVFPRDRVTATLLGVGRTVAAHGTTEMPVWGPLFRVFESDARVHVRIENLVDYVQTLQASPAASVVSITTQRRTQS